jgi:hypothetical protein
LGRLTDPIKPNTRRKGHPGRADQVAKAHAVDTIVMRRLDIAPSRVFFASLHHVDDVALVRRATFVMPPIGSESER